jgi:uncharacterized protein
MFRLNHHWFDSYRFSISTNGLNYHTEKVQNFIKKNHLHLSLGITIDGTKFKHDLNRIYKPTNEEAGGQSVYIDERNKLKREDGVDIIERGSYYDVVKNVPLWISQFPDASTKVTISSPDIPYIKDSVIHLFNIGITNVNINCVFEDVWQENDDVIFEEQLINLADYILENKLYENYTCSFFEESIGKPLSDSDNHNWCGAGKMLAIDAAGYYYPCTRFAQYSLRNKRARIIGNVEDGINKNLLRPFLSLDRKTQSPEMCINCQIASGCAWCQGENYDSAETETIYQRSTAICKMHKARVRANNYYWSKLSQILNSQE